MLNEEVSIDHWRIIVLDLDFVEEKFLQLVLSSIDVLWKNLNIIVMLLSRRNYELNLLIKSIDLHRMKMYLYSTD